MADDQVQEQPFDLGTALARIGNIPTQDMPDLESPSAMDDRFKMALGAPNPAEPPSPPKYQPNWLERQYEAAAPYLPEHARNLYEGIRNRAENLWSEAQDSNITGQTAKGLGATFDPVSMLPGANSGLVADELRAMYASRLGTRELPSDYDLYKYSEAENAARERFARENPETAQTIGSAMEASLSHPYGLAHVAPQAEQEVAQPKNETIVAKIPQELHQSQVSAPKDEWFQNIPKEWLSTDPNEFSSFKPKTSQGKSDFLSQLNQALDEYEAKHPGPIEQPDLQAAIDYLNARYAKEPERPTQAPQPAAQEVTYHTPTPSRIAELIKNGDSTDWQNLIEILKQKGGVDPAHLSWGEQLVEGLKEHEDGGSPKSAQDAYKKDLASHFKPQLDALLQPPQAETQSKIPVPDWADKELWAKAPQTADGWANLVGAGDPLVRELKQFENYEQQGKYSPENITESKQFTQHLLIDKYKKSVESFPQNQAPAASTPDATSFSDSIKHALSTSAQTVPAHYAVSNDFGLEVGHYATEAEAKAAVAKDPSLQYYHVPEQSYGSARDTYVKAAPAQTQAKPSDLSQLKTSSDWENYLGKEATADDTTKYILDQLKYYESPTYSGSLDKNGLKHEKDFYKNWLTEKYAPKPQAEQNPHDIGYTPKSTPKPQFTPSSERWPRAQAWSPEVATEPHKQAISGYTDGDFHNINKYYYGAQDAPSKLSDHEKEITRHLDDITRHSSFDEPIKRDLSARVKKLYQSKGYFVNGAEYPENGFGSFSRNLNYTHEGKGPEAGGFTIQVDNPGNRFAYIAPHSEYEHEGEVLAARNTNYRVRQWDPSTGILHVEVVRAHEIPSLVGVRGEHLENLPISKMREYTDKEFPWEYREYEKYAAEKFPGAFKNAEDFKKQYDAAPLTHLTEQQLKNLDYSTASQYMNDNHDVVHRAHEDFGHRRDTRSIEDDILNGQSAPPIVLKHKGGLRILGGNTRLSMAAAHGYNMPVKLIDISGSQ